MIASATPEAPWSAPAAPGPVAARVGIPGTKSGTARSLVLASLADGPGSITGGLAARDTDLMKGALRGLGVGIDDADPGCWLITPPPVFSPGTTIDCGLAGTVMRFVPPVAALADGTTRFVGDPAAEGRPVAPLLNGLRQAGAQVAGDRLPFSVAGPVSGGEATIDSHASSQFISGLLLAAARFPAGLVLTHSGPRDVPSRPHIDMTVAMLAARGVAISTPDAATWVVAPGKVAATDDVIEPDLTTAAVFLAAALVVGGSVSVPGWPAHTVQPGAAVPDMLTRFGGTFELRDGILTVTGDGRLSGVDVDLSETSELTPVVAALAALADGPSTIRGVAHIRGHETDRLAALEAEINALGGRARQTSDGLHIDPVPLTGGLFGCYADHRMAHAGALIGLAVPGVTLDDVACTSKTMPGFAAAWITMLASR